MNLTKKEAVRLHRLLWNKIADIIERDGLIYNDAITLKHKAIEELRALGEYYGDAPFLHCFCCEYTENLKNVQKGCSKCCPIIWDEPGKSCGKSEYGHFVDHIESGEMYEARLTAKIIAEFPERPDEEFDILEGS